MNKEDLHTTCDRCGDDLVIHVKQQKNYMYIYIRVEPCEYCMNDDDLRDRKVLNDE